MAALPIIKQLDVVEQRGPGLVPVEKGLMKDPFVFQRAEKAFDHGVVVAVSFATHAGPHAMGPKLTLVETAGILDALIAVVDQPRQRMTMRHRMHLMRKRTELLTHIQNTNSQYNLPEIGVKIAYKANRIGIAERFPQPAVARSISVDIALIDHYDQLLGDLELYIVRTAKEHDSNTFHRLRSIQGVGKILTLVLLYEIHDIDRFPTVQDFVSYCRLVKCAKESAGKRSGTGGKKIGNAHLKWAFSEAAAFFLRANPPAKQFLKRLTQKHGKGKALSILAHRLGRAVFYMMKRKTTFDQKKFLAESPGADGSARRLTGAASG